MDGISDNFIKRYCGLYTLYLIGATALFTGVTTLLDWDAGSSLGLVIAMICAYPAGDKFVRDHARLPAKKEKRVFGVICSLIAIFLPLVPLAVLIAMMGAQERADFLAEYAVVPVWVWLVSIPFVTGLGYLLVGWGFSSGAKWAIKRGNAGE